MAFNEEWISLYGATCFDCPKVVSRTHARKTQYNYTTDTLLSALVFVGKMELEALYF